MGKKKNRISDVRFIEMYSNKRKELIDTYVKRFKYKNLPDGLNSERLEEMILNNGQISAFYDDKIGDILILQSSKCSMNVYNEPVTLNVFGLNYNKVVKAKDCITYRDSITYEPFILILNEYTMRLTKMNKLLDEHLLQLRSPFAFPCTKDTLLSAQNKFTKMSDWNSDNVLFEDVSLSQNENEGIRTLDMRVQYQISDIMDDIEKTENKFRTLLGINNANTVKKERLIVDEVNSNNDFIHYNLEKDYQKRVEFFEEVNKKFGKNIEVEKIVTEEEIGFGGGDEDV